MCNALTCGKQGVACARPAHLQCEKRLRVGRGFDQDSVVAGVGTQDISVQVCVYAKEGGKGRVRRQVLANEKGIGSRPEEAAC